MEVSERIKQMIIDKKVALSENLEHRALNDKLTHEDINFLKRAFNMTEWAEKNYRK